MHRKEKCIICSNISTPQFLKKNIEKIYIVASFEKKFYINIGTCYSCKYQSKQSKKANPTQQLSNKAILLKA